MDDIKGVELGEDESNSWNMAGQEMEQIAIQKATWDSLWPSASNGTFDDFRALNALAETMFDRIEPYVLENAEKDVKDRKESIDKKLEQLDKIISQYDFFKTREEQPFVMATEKKRQDILKDLRTVKREIFQLMFDVGLTKKRSKKFRPKDEGGINFGASGGLVTH